MISSSHHLPIAAMMNDSLKLNIKREQRRFTCFTVRYSSVENLIEQFTMMKFERLAAPFSEYPLS